VSPESSGIEILDQLRWSSNKEKDCLRDYMAEKGGGSFSGWCKLGRREMGTWIFVRAGKPMRAWVLTGLGSQVHSGTILVDS
jgi:hypothetical protein